jgi:adenine-specific DNA-methyltransferase
MGEYFNTVTLPRMKKVVYSADWKSGKPQNRNTGVSHIMKYITLESYEDTLSNIELDDEAHRLYEYMGEDYLPPLHARLRGERQPAPLDAFNAPFHISLKSLRTTKPGSRPSTCAKRSVTI